MRVHFVWATWDRQPLITVVVERYLYRYISSVCQDDGCGVMAINGMLDHVHVLANLGSTISVADLMKHVKGGSSRFFSQTLTQGEWSHGKIATVPSVWINKVRSG